MIWYFIIGMLMAGVFNSVTLNLETLHDRAKSEEDKKFFREGMRLVSQVGIGKMLAVLTLICVFGWPFVLFGGFFPKKEP